MKVIVSGYVGRRITGIGRSLISWLNRIQREDIQFVVYTNKDMKNDLKFDNPNVTVKTYGVSRENSIGNLLWTTFVLPIKALQERANVTLITNFTLLLFPVKPTVIFLHDMTEYRVPEKQSKLRVFYRTKLAIPVSARNAKKIITVSQNSAKDIKEILHIKDEKLAFVYNGVDRNHFSKMSDEAANKVLAVKGWASPFILFVGTIDHPGRNLINLIKAYESLRESNDYNGRLILAGRDGKGADVVKDYISNSKYRNDVIVTGYITDEELLAFYSQCDAFCYLSLYEGFGMPPVEAMSCSAHVIVSNTSSLPEAVGDVGMTIDPNNVNDIKSALIKTIKSPSNDLYLEKVNHHLSKFSWDNEAQKLGNVLKKVYDETTKK